MKNNQERFLKWLSGKISPSRISDYHFVFEDIEGYAKQKHITSGLFFEATDPVISKKLLMSIGSDRFFRFLHKRKMREITEVVQYFHRFTKENAAASEKTTESISTVPDAPSEQIKKPVATTASVLAQEESFGEAEDRIEKIKDIAAEIPSPAFSIVHNIAQEQGAGEEKTEKGLEQEREAQIESFPPNEENPQKEETKKFFSAMTTIGDMRRAFIQWMETQGYSPSTCNGYASAIASMDEYAIKEGLLNCSFYEMSDYGTVHASWDKLISSRSFEAYNTIQHYRFSASMKKYLVFRQLMPHVKVASEPFQQSDLQTEPAIHPGRREFEAWMHETKMPYDSVKRYADSVERLGRFLIEKELENRNLFAIRGVTRLEKIRSMLQEGMAYDAEDGREKITLDLEGLSKYISFRKKGSAVTVEGEEARRFSEILRDRFESGYRLNSFIDRNRFKQYYIQEYGDEIQQDDEEILHLIRQVGTQQEDRVFLRSGSSHGDLLDDILAEVAKTFRVGATCIYDSRLYERYQEELGEQFQIYHSDGLKVLLLQACYGEFTAGKQCLLLSGRSANPMLDIQNLLRKSSTPLDYADIQQKLWYLPMDTIKHCLVTAENLVNVAQDRYFYAPNLPVSTEELNHIASLIHSELRQRSFLTDRELWELIQKRCPSVIINTEGMPDWGLRKCLSVLLRDRFSFRGPIISEKGQALSMAQVFAEYCRSQEKMWLEELKDFAKEINKGNIYWDAVMEEMIRISQNEFLPKSKISFDVEATDAVLDKELQDEDYAPLKSCQLFLHYPPLSVQWNEFVLESYVAGYSQKFSLMHAGYTEKECCGGIVRKESKIQDFQSLVTDMLSHSWEWETKTEALSLLVDSGYLQRRHYAKLDLILPEAIRLRDGYDSKGEQ